MLHLTGNRQTECLVYTRTSARKCDGDQDALSCLLSTKYPKTLMSATGTRVGGTKLRSGSLVRASVNSILTGQEMEREK